MTYDAEKPLKLPSDLITRADLRRLIVELEDLDNELTTESIHQRTGHEDQYDLATSQMLGELITTNDLDIKDRSSRSELLDEMRRLKDHAPVIHITFATTAKQDVLSRLVSWLRDNIHPHSIIDVGLQPNLIGGAHVRTTNKVFDMSVRSQLAKSRRVIVEELEAISGIK